MGKLTSDEIAKARQKYYDIQVLSGDKTIAEKPIKKTQNKLSLFDKPVVACADAAGYTMAYFQNTSPCLRMTTFNENWKTARDNAAMAYTSESVPKVKYEPLTEDEVLKAKTAIKKRYADFYMKIFKFVEKSEAVPSN